MRVENRLADLSNDLRVHGGILVIGAGGSYESGMPLYKQFVPLLWRVLDKYPEIKINMGYAMTDAGKDIVSENQEKIMISFKHMSESKGALHYFKEEFKIINDNHNISTSKVHLGICELIHRGYIKLVISLNWDDLLETSWEKLYGTSINSNRIQLIKPHGDIRNLKERWLLPHEEGDISEQELRLISSIKQNHLVDFIILGYSESDSLFVEKALIPNYKDSKVFKISPAAFDSIALPASDAIDKLLLSLPESQDDLWTKVDYSNQKGIASALYGYRLRPTDVEACARFPQIKEAKKKLDNIGYIVIKSEPGCGKSIMSFQIAQDYQKSGWEIKQLVNKNVQSEIIFPDSDYKTVYLIDDAHQIDDIILENAINQLTDSRKLIIARTSVEGFDIESINISNTTANEAIFKHYLEHEDAIIAILNDLRNDIKIGDLHMEQPFVDLLKGAKEEKSPWLFNYYLRGGWNGISESFSMMHDTNRSDVTIALIAVKQILSMDKEVDFEWLNTASESLGYLEGNVENNLLFLQAKKMILHENGFRTLHLQMAKRIIMIFFRKAKKDEKDLFIQLIRHELLQNDTTLMGINWLINLTFAYDLSSYLHREILSQEITERLLKRCFKQTKQEFVRDGSFLITNLIARGRNYTYKKLIENHESDLIKVINQTNAITAYSNAQIINDMYNEDCKMKVKFVKLLNTRKIATELASITNNGIEIYSWAHFLNRLSIGQSKLWEKQFGDILPKKELSVVFNNFDVCATDAVTSMLSSIYHFDSKYAAEKYDCSLPSFKKNLRDNFSETIRNIDYMFRYVFWGDELFTTSRRKKEQKLRLQAFSNLIDSATLKKAIEDGFGRDWHEIYRLVESIDTVDHQKLKLVFRNLDLPELSKKTIGLWKEQPNDLLMLISLMHYYGVDTNNIIRNHFDEIKFIRPHLLMPAIKLMDEIMEMPIEVILIEEHYSWGEESALFLKKLSKTNKNYCKKIIEQNQKDIEKNFLLMDPINWESGSSLMIVILELYPELIIKLSAELDNELTKKTIIAFFIEDRYKHHREKKSVCNFNAYLKNLVLVLENEELIVFLNHVISNIDSIEWTRKKNIISLEL
ncbi:hypothetical protein HB943_15785 [Listeria weihenstephanensis]|uniref:Novel STAND NTPase 3 domain-containing protein n=1 Tax=Listeria weihenstephanensis TaxID=1006155 RepID=A0A841ZCR8_9LIST|nr:hypothetical protein [Listeria weihenstephanensis]MBC1502063.1 hypothetical protein [Listeria weihenstephanensis]